MPPPLPCPLPNKHNTKHQKKQVDVVMITPDADPPVVRLIAFSKYKYEMEKSAKQKQKASKG